MAKVQFILGRSGTGKTRRCIDGVCEALTKDADSTQPLVLLVPEQATYQAERAILSHPDIAGFSRLHVLSFNRLGFWLGGSTTDSSELSHTGKQMVLHKLLLEHSEQMTLYKGQAQRMGLAQRLSDLLTDFQHADCTAEHIKLLAESLAAKQGRALAAAKWADIANLFKAYEAFFKSTDNDFSNPDRELNQVRDRVAAAPFLQEVRLWVDGFSGFSVQERNLLVELLKVCKDASIALCLDPSQIDLENDDEDKFDPCSMFASTERTYCELLRIVRGCKLDLSQPVILSEPLRFSDAPSLRTLETNLLSDGPTESSLANDEIRIAACGNVRAETRWVAGQIKTLVKDHGYRYRDIAVVVPQMDTYQHYIESAFAEQDLPYFLDRPRLMKVHPLTELIGSALQVVANNFSLSDVLNFLKSPLASTEIEQIDALEKYCRAFDIQGVEWLQKNAWSFAAEDEKSRYDEAAIDILRREHIKPLQKLHTALKKQGTMKVADFAQAVWALLENLDVANVLSQWAADDATDQQYGHRQVFAKLVVLIDEMCRIFNSVELEAGVWGSILTDALSSMTVKLIPPTLDQVLVGSIERSRHPDIKAIFLIGATQKQFPVPVVGETLLTEQEYRQAADARLELSNPYDVSLTHRPYLAYIALTRASDVVTITYPVLDEKGASVVPWSGIEQLTSMFKDVEIQYPPSSPQDINDIQNPAQLARWLCGTLGKDRGSAISDRSAVNSQEVAADVLKRMADSGDEQLSNTASRVQQALEHDNAAALEPQVADAMFTFPMNTSVTRLGTFAKCPYQYFAKYTLRLEREQLLRFEPMDVGLFYHNVLEAMFNTLKAQGSDWADLSGDDLTAMCDGICEQVLSASTQLINFIRRRAHHRYIIQSAKSVVRQFVPMLAQLSRVSQFKQTRAEMAFGPKEKMRLILPLDEKGKIEFRGYIDRLDTAEIDGKSAAVVFDYKSGGKSVNFAGMLYGLDLQLPVYLMAIAGQGMTPAGAFFLPIDGGTVSASPSELDSIQAGFNKAKGLFDGSFFDAIDTKAAVSGGRSEYFNFYVNKDGNPYSYYKTSGALKPEDFQTLLSHTEHRIKKLIADLAAGCISITPYRIAKTSPCTWCDYRPLCRFDWQINDYNLLDNISKEEALDKMKEKLR